IGASVQGAEGHLRGMAVVPSSQGCGVSSRLLESIENELRRAGCSVVTLDTTAPLTRAIRFYERNGYVRSGVVSDFFGMVLHACNQPRVAAWPGCYLALSNAQQAPRPWRRLGQSCARPTSTARDILPRRSPSGRRADPPRAQKD